MANLSRLFCLSLLKRWPGPVSLATTTGVSIDVLSSGYLDVSVLRVCLLNLCIQFKILLTQWVFPFGNFRVKACSRLTETYRNVLRPSSPLSAKASTKCPYKRLITQHHAQGQTRPYAIRHYFLFTFSMNRPSEFKTLTNFLSLIQSYATKAMVGLVRFELTTSRLSSARSNQLSYKP